MRFWIPCMIVWGIAWVMNRHANRQRTRRVALLRQRARLADALVMQDSRWN